MRLVWIGLAVEIPFAVGITMALRGPRGSALSAVNPPAARESAVRRLLRGFPTTIGIAAAFFVVFVTVPALRMLSLIRRQIDLQVPLVTDRDHYHPVAAEIAEVLSRHDFPVREVNPGWWMTLPSRILLWLGGPAFRDHIPDRLAYFRADRLEVALYPNGLLLRGSAQDTAWAHGIVVEALSAAPALQTFDPRAQDLERQIRRVWSIYQENPAAHKGSALSSRLIEIAEQLRRAPVTYDEWQVVYRQTLQLGRALGGDRQLLETTVEGRSTAVDSTTTQEEYMTASKSTNGSARELSNRTLISEITAKAMLLAQKEIELAKTEIRADLSAQLGMVKALGVAAIVVLLAVNLLLVAVVLALSLVIPGWLAALIVGGVLLLTGAIVGTSAGGAW